MKWFLKKLIEEGHLDRKDLPKVLSNKRIFRGVMKEAALYDTLAFGLTYLPHHFRAPPAPFHYEVSEKLAKRTYYAVAAPRGHAKSTLIALAHPLLEAAAGRSKFILILGADGSSAEDRLEDILNEIADNHELLERFPHLRPPDPQELKRWAKQKKKYKQKRSDYVTIGGIRFSARGAGQALRGMKQGQNRPDLIILDDVDTDKNCESSKQIVKLHRWFDTVVMNLEGVETARIRAAGTMLCRRALISVLIDRWGGDVYRAILDEEKRETLWPEVWPYDRLIMKRDGGFDADGTRIEGIGKRRFAREYQNDPSPEDETFITEEQVRIVDKLPMGYPEGGYYTAGLDLAVGMDTKSSQNAIVLMWHSDTGTSFIIAAERWRGVAGLEDRVNRFLNENALVPPRMVAVEAVQYQVRAVLDLSVALPYRFVPVHPDRSKSARFALIADRFVNGQIQVLSSVPRWYLDDLFSFPVGSSTWDGIDATVYAYLARFGDETKRKLTIALIPQNGGGDWQ